MPDKSNIVFVTPSTAPSIVSPTNPSTTSSDVVFLLDLLLVIPSLSALIPSLSLVVVDWFVVVVVVVTIAEEVVVTSGSSSQHALKTRAAGQTLSVPSLCFFSGQSFTYAQARFAGSRANG